MVLAYIRALKHHRSVLEHFRCFSTSSVVYRNRAIVYVGAGDPASVLSSMSFPSLPPPAPNTVNVKFLLSPINPADLNVIEGVYPSKPNPRTNLASSGRGSSEQPVFVPGNEGLAEITAIGRGVTDLKCGEWVTMAKQQAGTWISNANLGAHEVLRIPKVKGNVKLSEVQAATLTVCAHFYFLGSDKDVRAL
jgi:mitochondrial enoyl-[acyl-carrier protein] reductase / trans-2-enoyl-CoA reductase